MATGEGPTVSETLSLEETVTRIQNRYQAIRDLQADFRQVTHFAGFSNPITTQGKFYLKSNRLRWDANSPAEQQIFVSGDEILVYVPAHQQVIRSTLDRVWDAQIPIQRLLAGGMDLQETFRIGWAEDGRARSTGGMVTLALFPKTSHPGITRMTLQVEEKDGLIREITLQEPGGNRSVITFSIIQINQGLEDTLFVPNFPEGVVIIQQP